MRRQICALAITLLAGGLYGAAPALAQADGPAEIRAQLVQLKERAEKRFQIVPLRRGLMLVPKSDASRARSIEIADGQVLVDGTPVTGRELRDRIGDDADVVGQLSFLDAAARRQLFSEAPAAARPPEPPAPSVVPPAPGEPAVSAVPATPSDGGWNETARSRRGGARFRLGGDVTVKPGETVGSDVVVVLGSAHVEGRVDGDVVAVGGSVFLGPKADVQGSVTSVGGQVSRAGGAQVAGEINEVRVSAPAFGPAVRIGSWRNWTWFSNAFSAPVAMVGTVVRMGLVGLFAALLVAMVPGPVRRVADRVSAEPWRAGLVGLAAQLLFVPLLVLTVVVLAVSIIGIPLLLLVPFALVVMLIGLLLGFAGAGCAVGDLVGRRSSSSAQTLLVSLVVGLAVIWGLTVIARVAGLTGLPIRMLVGILLFAGFLIEYLALTVGFGAVLLSRFGRRGGARDATFVPPPMPGFASGSGSGPSL
jgi:hypothetical protein